MLQERSRKSFIAAGRSAVTRGGEAVEDAGVDALGIVVGLERERRQGRDQHGRLDPRRAVDGQVAGDLTGAQGESGQHRLAQVEPGEQDMEVGGEGVEVISGAGPAGGAGAPPVVGDDPVPGSQQGCLLFFPGVPVQRVAVHQHEGRTGPVIFVVDPDGGGILPSDSDKRHRGPHPFVLAG